jgi:hypothetical protein
VRRATAGRRGGLFASLLSIAFVVNAARAQDSAATKPRYGLEFGLGLATRVPAIPEGGIGPVISVLARKPSQRGVIGFIAGASYALVPQFYRRPDREPNNSAAEALLLTVGPEFVPRRSMRVDLLWTPAIARVRRWGAQPVTRAVVPTQHDWSALSLGIRWGSPSSRVGYALRLHASLNPVGRDESAYPSFQIMVRP